jgi:hypothetical protein
VRWLVEAAALGGRGEEETMAKEKQDGKLNRRGFLKSVGGVGVAAATAAGIGSAPAKAAESEADKKKARYQANSPHVQAYYRTNRY